MSLFCMLISSSNNSVLLYLMTFSIQAEGACDVDPSCNCVLNTCFHSEQTINIDNCWFILPPDKLNMSATIVVTVYNQALLFKEIVFNVN